MQRTRSFVSLAGAFALLASVASGSGFAILEQSPRGLGASFAGMAAKIDDPGSLFYNPAVSSWFKQSQVALGINILRANASFSNDGSAYDYTPYGQGPTLGDNGGNAGGYSFIPNNYMVFPVAEDFAFGLGITATSGTATEWGWGWVGRYQAIKTAATTIDFSPSASWRVADNFSVGAGLTVQYMQFEKINAIDGYSAALHAIQAAVATGRIAPAQAGDLIADLTTNSALRPGTIDSILEINEDSLALGWNVGLLYEPWEGTRVGLSYRSRISHSPEGDAEYDLPNVTLGTANPMSLADLYNTADMYVDTDTESDMDLPPMFIFGLYQRLNEKWALLLDVEHTMWSSIDVITTIFDSSQDNHVTRFEWEDTWRVALGFEWYYNDAFTFRFGGAWDQAPCKEPAFRTPRMPDVDRYWASLGMTYKFSENLELDVSYMHLFMDKGNAEFADENTHQTLSGTYVGSADLLSFGVIWKY